MIGMTQDGKVVRTMRWDGTALARPVADVVATAKVRPGLPTSRRTTVDVDAELWERLLMVASQAESGGDLGVRGA